MFSHFRIVLISTIILTFSFADIWINEFHYDDPSGDSGEGVEIIAPSDFTDLSNITLELYNGSSSQRKPYGTHTLDTFDVGETVNGFTVYSKSISGIQNGAPDGFSLDNAGTLLSFICYEGTFEAAEGVAVGVTCTDVGVAESGSGAEDQSVQLVGTGSSSSDFTWQVLDMYTFGSLNTGQTLNASGGDDGGGVTCDDATACNDGASEACTYAADACTACDGTNLGGQDDCGVCGGDNSTCADCCNVPNGDGSTCDGVCGACNDATSCLDCCGVANGDGSTCDGVCGACNDATSCLDCEGTVNGTVAFDSFGLCGGDGTAVANLFFSEHAEGSSNNKYFEIYNASSVAVSLDSYDFVNCSNQCTDWEYTNSFASGATVASGDVYAVCHSSFAGDLTLCDETRVLYHNGDDAQALRYSATEQILDRVGTIGDGTTHPDWDVCGDTGATKDHTLVRKSSVATGNDDWAASAGTTADDCEWIVNPQDYWTDLGSHTYDPPTDPCAGVDCSGNDTACTTSSCVDGSCVDTNVADGTACDDGNGSTTGDVCTAGTCAGTVPTYTVTFDLDGLDHCGFVSVHGNFPDAAGATWSGWNAHTDTNMQATVPAGDYEFVILCVDNTIAGWYNDIFSDAVWYNPPSGSDCEVDGTTNYGFSVVDSDVTVSYCAGTCDATCATTDPCANVTCDTGYSCDSTGNCVADVDPCADVTCNTGEECDATGTCVVDCDYHDSGIVFSGDFGGAYDCGNSYIVATGSEGWAGFANEDTDMYPFSFPNGGTVTFTGSALDADVDVFFNFEYQPYPNVVPEFSTAAVTVSGSTPTAYSVDIPAQPADHTFSSFLLYLVELDRYVTLTDVAVNGSVALVSGCMDSNADNYNADATVQAQDQYGNLLCSFGSCDELLVSYPDGACLYGLGDDEVENHVGLFQLDADPPFGPTECEVWGTACVSGPCADVTCELGSSCNDTTGLCEVDPLPSSVTFDLDGLDDCGFVSATGTFSVDNNGNPQSWNGWGATNDNSWTVSVPAGDHQFTVLCVSQADVDAANGWWDDIWGNSTQYQAGSDCGFDNGSGGLNYGFTVDGSGNAMTVQYCAGTCDATCPVAQAENLFFSEAAEGSSDNKYLEIYNPTNTDVDLSGYLLGNTSNAPTVVGEPEYFLSLTGSIAAGGVYAVCDPDFAGDLTLCDQTHWALSNGDDGYCLLFGTETSYSVLDCVGDWNGDPGSGWSVAGVSNATKDHTLVRKSSVTTGNIDWTSSAGTTEEDSEWVVLDQNTWNYLGSHPHDFNAVCDDATACNYLQSGDCVFANTGEDCNGNALYNLTFSVNMAYAGGIDTENGVRVFGSWGTGFSSSDAVSATCDENDLCTASITLPAGDYLYKFRNGWSYENVDGLSCAVLDDPDGDGFGYWNRSVTLSGDSNLGTVCFGVCADCIGGCTDSSASNTDDNANVDDGSCEYTEPVANLFFSEYAEGSSNNKYLEIYNASNDTVTLGNYAYPNANNGSDGTHNYWNAFDDGASVAAGDVYVICHGSFAGDQTQCDEFHNYLSNGDDGYCLVFGPDDGYEVLDCIGDFGADPGSGWAVAGVDDATKDHTLVRKSDVTTGNDGYWEASAGTEDDDSEWHVLDKDTWTFLGSHPHTLVYGCTDVAANNTNGDANVEDGSCTYPLSLTLETCSSASSVRMTGTWWGWDPAGGPIAVDNGNGSWTVTFDPAPDADMEYLWVVDGVQEALFDNAANGECAALIDNGTLVTDYANWGNRWWLQDGNRTDVYDSCADECQYTVSFTADMNCADYTPVSGDVVHVQGMNTGWGSVFTDLSDDDGDGVWTGSGSIPAGTYEWKLSVGHWNNDTQTWNAWEAQEDLAGLSCATQVPNTDYWNRVTVVTDSDVSETVTYGSCTDCTSCSDLTCESWESCADVAYTAPVCECTDNGGNVNGLGDINVTDIVALVGWILGCSGDATCFTAEQICNGDLNDDGAVNVIDVTALVNIILADRISYDDATSANIVLTNNTISVNSDGYVAGVQMTLSHGSNFSLDLEDSYVSEYSTIGNKTTLLLVATGNSLEEIATYKGSFEVESIVLCNSNDEIFDVNVINVNSVEVKLAGPNPFNPSTSLNIVVAQDGFVSVNVYNLVGQKVATLLNGYMDANLNGYPVNFNGSNLASGVYLVRAETAGNVSTQKLMLLK